VVLTGHTAPVVAVAFSSDASLLATSGRDESVMVWETQTGALQRVYEPRCVCDWIDFGPGDVLAVGVNDGLAYCEGETGVCERPFPSGGYPVAFDGDRRRVATVNNTSLLFYDVPTGALVRRVTHGVQLHGSPPAAAISADGDTGAVSGRSEEGYELRAWDLRSGALKCQRRVPRIVWAWARDPQTGRSRRTRGAYGDVHRLALSPDGRLLAVGGSATLWVCNTRTGRRTHVLLCGYWPHSFAFSPDGTILAAGVSDGSIVLWHTPSGRPMHAERPHSSWISAISFSRDGTLLASGSHDKSVAVWRVGSDEEPRRVGATLDFEASSVAWSPDGARIAASYTDGSIRIWSARTGWLERLIVAAPGRVRYLHFSSDGEVLASGIRPADAAWSVQSGEQRRAPEPLPEAEFGETPCEATSADGRLIASSTGWEGVIEIRSADTMEVVQTVVDPDEGDIVVALAFSADGRRLASGYFGFRARVWDIETGRRIQLLRAHEDEITSLAFSPDGTLLAVGGSYGSVVVLCNLRKELRPVRVVLTPKERRDSEFWSEILDIPPEELPAEEVALEGHTGNIRGVCFSADGRRVATVAADAALKVWDPDTGQLLATLLPMPSPAGHPSEDWIAHTPDGYYACSPGAVPWMRWNIDGEMQDAAAHASSYHLPGLVAERLQ
jgi:WD40 repeat protein